MDVLEQIKQARELREFLFDYFQTNRVIFDYDSLKENEFGVIEYDGHEYDDIQDLVHQCEFPTAETTDKNAHYYIYGYISEVVDGSVKIHGMGEDTGSVYYESVAYLSLDKLIYMYEFINGE